jgi:dTDP-4-amino-4,6-dideoxygalactose transaminase
MGLPESLTRVDVDIPFNRVVIQGNEERYMQEAVLNGHISDDCPVTESVADRLLRLPFSSDLIEQDQSRVIDVVRDFRC